MRHKVLLSFSTKKKQKINQGPGAEQTAELPGNWSQTIITSSQRRLELAPTALW